MPHKLALTTVTMILPLSTVGLNHEKNYTNKIIKVSIKVVFFIMWTNGMADALANHGMDRVSVRALDLA